MFWIGFACGTGMAFLFVVIGLSAMTWSVSKERKTAANITDKYWAESLEVQRGNAATFERIAEMMAESQRTS